MLFSQWAHSMPFFCARAATAGREQGQQVTISDDAGLFVCNHTYYTSLKQSQRSHGKQKWHSVFIHVPPFNIILPEKQLSIAAAILDSIAAAVAPVQGQPVVLGQEVEHSAKPVAARHDRGGRSMLSCFSCCNT